MKKSRSMRLASALLVLTLLSTCMISGTFAKYTTQDNGSDLARVAKWGVELQVVGNLYGDTYRDVIVEESATDLTVQSVDKTADVVAPGTRNDEGFTFSLKGKPEVDGTVTTEMKIQNVFLKAGTYGVMIPVDTNLVKAATFSEFNEFTDLYRKDGNNYVAATEAAGELYTLEDYVVVSDDYYPVVYNLAGNTSNTGADTVDSLKAAADKIATQLGIAIDDTKTAAEMTDGKQNTTKVYYGTKKFEANDDLASWAVDGLTLKWAWEFGDPDKVGDTADENDKADTILGMLENTTEGTVVKLDGTTYKAPVEYTDYCLDTQFSIDITVTQVD